MKRIGLIGLIGLLAFVAGCFSGCTSFINGVKNTRMTAVDLAYGGYIGWTNYYCTRTNLASTTPAQLATLNDAQRIVKDARLKFGATVGVLDGWLDAYQTNSAVKPELQAGLDATLSSASNIVWLVNFYQGK